MAIAFAFTIWLHCARGQGRANRFGPVPDASGFSAHFPCSPGAVSGAGMDVSGAGRRA
jgi:hypothetical protein